jgi:PAS domain S-box-containing protein
VTFGQYIRQLRRAKGLSQRELAEKVGIDYTYLNKIEADKRPPPSEKTILGLAHVLDVDEYGLFVVAKKIPSYLQERVDSEIMKKLSISHDKVQSTLADHKTFHQHTTESTVSGFHSIRAKDTKHERDRLYRALIENSLDGILLLNSDLDIIYESPSAAIMFGYHPGELSVKDALGVIHPDDASWVATILTQIVDDPGATVSGAARVKHRDGTWRVIESIIRNLLDDPVLGGILVNCRDITDRLQEGDSQLQLETDLAAATKYNLSESEQKVLALMSEGRSNQQIAEQLLTTSSTVKFHVGNILRKLDVANRTEAVAIALRYNLSSLP